MTAALLAVLGLAFGWYALRRVEAHLLRTGKDEPAQVETRLLPVWHLPAQGAAMSDEEFFVHLAQLGVRDQLLDAAREADAGVAPVPDGFIEIRRGGAR